MTLGDGSNNFKIGIEPGTFPPFTSGEFKEFVAPRREAASEILEQLMEWFIGLGPEAITGVRGH